jgi:hypothetical protein
MSRAVVLCTCAAVHKLELNKPYWEILQRPCGAGPKTRSCGSPYAVLKGSYLVDPASSHMLVSKIKPCMSKYKLLYTVKLRMAH